MNPPLTVAILGTGNIGSDLMYKVLKNPHLSLELFAGIDPKSEGLALAKELGVSTSSHGIEAVLESGTDVVIDATTAKAHRAAAPRLRAAGQFAIDLTPAALGPSVVPVVNLDANLRVGNVNLISCAAQATVPIIHAISQVTPVKYGEIASAVATRSAGPGTRQNIDEFTRTTTKALCEVGGARAGKTILAINSAEPSIMMRNTVYARIDPATDYDALLAAIHGIVAAVQEYVPGYRLSIDPILEGDFVTVGVEVEGAGDFLPSYSGNLDIITSAAVAVAEKFAKVNQTNQGASK